MGSLGNDRQAPSPSNLTNEIAPDTNGSNIQERTDNNAHDPRHSNNGSVAVGNSSCEVIALMSSEASFGDKSVSSSNSSCEVIAFINPEPSFGDKSVSSSESENSFNCSSPISCPSTVVNEKNITSQTELQSLVRSAAECPTLYYRTINEMINFIPYSYSAYAANLVNDKRIYTCNECLYKSNDSKRLLSHVRIHAWLKEVRDPSPNTERERYSLLNVRRSGDSETKQSTLKRFRCQHCLFSCDESCTLSRHQTVHAEKSDTFNQAAETSKTIFYCSHNNCSFLCNSLETFKRHQEFHDEKYQELLDLDQGEPQFSCRVCSFSCTTREHLFRHEEIHSKSSQSLRKDLEPIKKKFRCSICPFYCEKKLTLERHRNTHLKVSTHVPEAAEPVAKKFKCSICPFACAKKQYLVQHINRHLRNSEDVLDSKPIQKVFQCCICDVSYGKEKDLVSHEERHAALSEEFEQVQNEEHNFKCKKCLNTYTEKLYRDIHQNAHNEKFKCLYCGKGYKIRKAFKRHLEICKQ